MSTAPQSKGVPLRVTLVAALLSLVTLGLLASAVATNRALNDYLVQRTDAQLTQDAGSFVRRLDQPSFPRTDPRGPRPPSRYYVAIASMPRATPSRCWTIRRRGRPYRGSSPSARHR